MAESLGKVRKPRAKAGFDFVVVESQMKCRVETLNKKEEELVVVVVVDFHFEKKHHQYRKRSQSKAQPRHSMASYSEKQEQKQL